MKKPTLWTRNYKILTCASVLGAVGGIAGNYALSFLVYDETGSTLAAALLIAIGVIPQFVLPILVAPIMDRLPRKPFLVGGDLLAGILYGLAGLYLTFLDFNYIGYLLFSLLLASIGSLDSLAYNSIYPKIIPEGFEEKGYAFSGMLYPVMNVVMMPIAAVLMDTIGVANILLIQSGLSISAALIESRIKITENMRKSEEKRGISLWWSDFLDGLRYLKGERGLRSIYAYMAVTNGAYMGYSPILVAFFRTAPGFTTIMYSFFSVAEFLGRTLGGIVNYRMKIPKEKKFAVTFGVYQVYDTMDAVLLWLPYPLMLVNRAICGFLGITSATLRQAAVQRYIPEEFRARVNAVQEASVYAIGSILALAIGFAGEFLDHRWAMSAAGIFTVCTCWLTVWRNRKYIKKIYEH